MNAAGMGIRADACADSFRQSRIPGGSQTNATRVYGGGKLLVAADAERSIGHLKRRKAETWHSADGEASAADVIKFLIERHLAEKGVHPVINFGIGRYWLERIPQGTKEMLRRTCITTTKQISTC